MNKAERIYEETKTLCRSYIDERKVDKELTGFDTVAHQDDEKIWWVDLEKLKLKHTRDIKMIEVDLELGIMTQEQADEELRVLEMLGKTIGNTKHSNK